MNFNIRSFTWLAVIAVAAGWLGNPSRITAAESSQETERKLIGVLQSDAPLPEKAITCKKLAIYGTKDAVPALAPLLANPDLSSWARTALEAIPDPAADAALREAMGKLEGRLLIGVINSVGFRKDAQAVSGLVQKLKDAEADVVSAAAAALGAIGGEPAAKALEQSLAGAPAGARAEIAEGIIRCAEQFLAGGNAAEAIRLCDMVRAANVPEHKMLEATRGAILARGAAGLPLLLEQLRSPDKARFSLGLHTVRELPGRLVTEALAAEMEQSPVARQILLVMALADRGDAAGLPAISKAAQNGPKNLRLAAIGALGGMDGSAAVPVLLAIAIEEDSDLAKAAKTSLARMPGKGVNADLAARLPNVTAKPRQVILDLSGQRGIVEALPVIAQYVDNADAGVRRAAVGSLGIIGAERQAAVLVKLLEDARYPEDRDAIEKALLAISGRRGAKCLPHLLPLAQNSDRQLRLIGLHTLSSVGGRTALATVKAALTDKDEAVQDEAVRMLSTWASNWPEDTGVAEPLLALAQSGQKTSHQVLGLRGYLTYVQGDKQLKDDDKVAKVKALMPLIKRPEEKRLAISALDTAPTAGALTLLQTIAADAAVAEEAYVAIVNIAARDDLKGASKELRRQALQTVLDKSKNDRTKKKAEAGLRKIQ